jgi:simple sugar transport system permease protein
MHKQSLFHISKRELLPLHKAMAIRIGIILLSLVFCGLVTTILTGQNPLSVYGTILDGAFGSARRMGVTFRNVAILLGIFSIQLDPSLYLFCIQK